jgi:hypothetical protein
MKKKCRNNDEIGTTKINLPIGISSFEHSDLVLSFVIRLPRRSSAKAGALSFFW